MLRRIVAAARLAPLHFRDSLKAVRVFASPAPFLARHLAGRPQAGHVLRFRDGLQLELSRCASDAATVMVVLVREDYAPIPPAGLVVDVGGNIGAFMIYAIRSGARRVISFEPSRDAFEVLRRNVERNRLGDRVLVRQLAVAGEAGRTVRFPTASDPSNHILGAADRTDAATVHADEVRTTSVSEIVDTYGDVDLLKLDCEGAEYEIVETTPSDVWRRIRAVKIEYHQGRTSALVDPLHKAGLHLVLHKPDPVWRHQIGMLHFDRRVT